MKEQAWNIRSQVVPNTGSGKVTPILEIDYRNVGGGGGEIIFKCLKNNMNLL